MAKEGGFKIEMNLDKRQKDFIEAEEKRDKIVNEVIAEYDGVVIRSTRKTFAGCKAQYQLEYKGNLFLIYDNGEIHWTKLASDIRKQLDKEIARFKK